MKVGFERVDASPRGALLMLVVSFTLSLSLHMYAACSERPYDID